MRSQTGGGSVTVISGRRKQVGACGCIEHLESLGDHFWSNAIPADDGQVEGPARLRTKIVTSCRTRVGHRRIVAVTDDLQR
jgi:hypothetical protein